MKCPRCEKQELASREVASKGVTLDVCPSCQGVWFDRGELEQALPEAAAGLTIPEDAEPGGGECPRCWGTMCTFIYPGTYVQVDMCRRCSGVWLDVGEIREIRVVRKAMGDAPPSKDPDGIGGIRGGLLRFIDSAFASFKQSGR